MVLYNLKPKEVYYAKLFCKAVPLLFEKRFKKSEISFLKFSPLTILSNLGGPIFEIENR